MTTNVPQIAVLDRGFVYIGFCQFDGEMLVISNAQNVRRWGTSRGLGELAQKGPQTNTRLDPAGTVRAPKGAVIHLIDASAEAWAETLKAGV